jgi:hypothetical protein
VYDTQSFTAKQCLQQFLPPGRRIVLSSHREYILFPITTIISISILLPLTPTLFLQDEILSIMASSRRLRQESKTTDSKATLSSYRERERTSSISSCTCARCARGSMPSAECCDAQQHNGLANWTGSRDANDFCLKNTVSNGLEVKVTKATVQRTIPTLQTIALLSIIHLFTTFLTFSHFLP